MVRDLQSRTINEMGEVVDGILNLNKCPGLTSHDVIDQVRRIFDQKRVGHAGTLDPMATGVLVVCLGKATRIVEYLSGGEKEYRAVLTLGVTTGTQDVTGEIVSESDASAVTLDALEKVTHSFVGEIQQVPPMVSAVKYQGQRLYKLAREGKTVERAARMVTVHSIDVTDFRPGIRAEAEIVVRCSGGTYIRTLCADIGEALGCGGMMSGLVRTRVGRFAIEQSVTVEQLAQAPGDYVISMADALCDMPAVVLDEEGMRRVLNGMEVHVGPGPHVSAQHVRMMSSDGELVAIGVVSEQGMVKPRKVLAG
jgi:tRNA pseudouridine55 synthase